MKGKLALHSVQNFGYKIITGEGFVRSVLYCRTMINSTAVWVRPRHPGGISSVLKGIVRSSAFNLIILLLLLIPFTERAEAG